MLGSSVIGAFLEFLNYKNARRTLVSQIIVDNNIIGNYMSDALWIYRNTLSPVIKIDALVELYEKTQSSVFILTKEYYYPFTKKDKLLDEINKNAEIITEIYNLLLEFHRTILINTKKMICLEIDEKTIPKGKTKESVLAEATLSLIEEEVEYLMTLEHKLAEFNASYERYFKLGVVESVKSHDETLEQIIKRIEGKDVKKN